MEVTNDALVQDAIESFNDLIEPPSTRTPATPLDTRLQSLEELSDRFRTWRSNIVCQSLNKTSTREHQSEQELLDTVEEVLQNINDDLVEGKSYGLDILFHS